MVEVSEAVREPADLLDDQVDGLGAAVGDPAGVEVGQHLGPPRFEGAPEPGDLGDRAGREAVDDLGRDLTAGGRAGVVDRAELLVALPGACRAIRLSTERAGTTQKEP